MQRPLLACIFILTIAVAQCTETSFLQLTTQYLYNDRLSCKVGTAMTFIAIFAILVVLPMYLGKVLSKRIDTGNDPVRIPIRARRARDRGKSGPHSSGVEMSRHPGTQVLSPAPSVGARVLLLEMSSGNTAPTPNQLSYRPTAASLGFAFFALGLMVTGAILTSECIPVPRVANP